MHHRRASSQGGGGLTLSLRRLTCRGSSTPPSDMGPRHRSSCGGCSACTRGAVIARAVWNCSALTHASGPPNRHARRTTAGVAGVQYQPCRTTWRVPRCRYSSRVTWSTSSARNSRVEMIPPVRASAARTGLGRMPVPCGGPKCRIVGLSMTASSSIVASGRGVGTIRPSRCSGSLMGRTGARSPVRARSVETTPAHSRIHGTPRSRVTVHSRIHGSGGDDSVDSRVSYKPSGAVPWIRECRQAYPRLFRGFTRGRGCEGAVRSQGAGRSQGVP